MNAKTLEDLQAELARQDAELAELFKNVAELPEDVQLAISEEWMSELDATTQPPAPIETNAHWAIRA